MPYEMYDRDGKFYAKNIRTGAITAYTSEENRNIGIRMREMYSHGWQPKKKPIGLAGASKATRRRVASIGGTISRRRR